MKRIVYIFTVLMISCTLPSFGQTSAWAQFSSKEKDWKSVSNEVPIMLKSTPVSADACDITGVYSGLNTIKLSGEAWPEGNVVRMKLKGTEAKVMFYGAVTYIDDETVWYEGTFSATLDNHGIEQPICCMLIDSTAKKEREAKEREQAEKEWIASPEYKLLTILEDLISSNRVGIVEKTKLNLGSAVNSAVNSDVSGITSSLSKNQRIDVLDVAGEAKKGTITKDPLSAHLTLKDKSSITTNFDASGTFKLSSPNIYVSVLYSNDMSEVLYLIRGEAENSAFLLYHNKLYKLDKKTVRSVESATFSDYIDFMRTDFEKVKQRYKSGR